VPEERIGGNDSALDTVRGESGRFCLGKFLRIRNLNDVESDDAADNQPTVLAPPVDRFFASFSGLYLALLKVEVNPRI
jgi:hypothetical protein